VFEALQSFLRESDMRLPVRERENHTQHDVIATGGKAHNLPSPREFFGKRANWQVLDEHSEVVYSGGAPIQILYGTNRTRATVSSWLARSALESNLSASAHLPFCMRM
jgi:hypothetical protein